MIKMVSNMGKEKNKCCGCQACAASCPTGSIEMVEDEEGFLYPQINFTTCIHCDKCEKNCPIVKREKGNEFIKCYAVKHKDTGVRSASRSGGIFTAISDIVLEKGGVIYGAKLTESLEVKHIRCMSQTERNSMRGSKYVQSVTDKTIYENVKKDLIKGREVLYSGTSCQVAALKSYLGIEYKNLLCMDIVCHGVPSPKVFRDYIKYQSSKMKKPITNVDFRNKKSYGWAGHVETITTDGGRKKDSCLYTMLFYQHKILRPVCYVCPYKGLMHPGDLTIADYWGIDKALPGFSDNKGVSLVLVNTHKGNDVLELAKHQSTIEAIETDINKSMQPPLKEPFKEPANRDLFWADYQQNGFEYIAKSTQVKVGLGL